MTQISKLSFLCPGNKLGYSFRITNRKRYTLLILLCLVALAGRMHNAENTSYVEQLANWRRLPKQIEAFDWLEEDSACESLE